MRLTRTPDICYDCTCQLHGVCSSAVEFQIVDLAVVGSRPTRHPPALLGRVTERMRS